jgi:hypothetical protein
MLTPTRRLNPISAILLFSLLCCGFSLDSADAQVVSQSRFYPADGWEVGNAMAASGNTLVVGDQAWLRNPDRTSVGAAYVFTLKNGTWSQAAELTASDGTPYALFGAAVAISGTTLVVGAPAQNGTGVVYVFTLGKTGWAQQAEIAPTDGTAGDRFGSAVAVSGTTLAVGASLKGGRVGAVYTYTLKSGNWTPQAEWAAPNPSPAGATLFGNALGLSSSTLLVGAPGANSGTGAAYLYGFNGKKWLLRSSLTPADPPAEAQFGYSVALSGSEAAVGAPGMSEAFTYTLSGTAWSLQSVLAPPDDPSVTGFGHALAINGNTLVVSALNAQDERAVYVFGGSKSGWAPGYELTPEDDLDQANAQFGASVALVGATVVVSRPLAWPGAVSLYAPLGELYSFPLPGGAETGASDGQPGDGFGYATAISGATLLAGAPGRNGSMGGVYAFTRTSGKLTGQTLITAANGQPGDGFGTTLAFDGATLVAGAPYANGGNGAVYLYTLSSGVWKAVAELTAGDGQNGDLFGNAVALSGSTVAIGAPGRNGGAGAVYVFTLNGVAWSQQAELVGADSLPGDNFGFAVGLSGGNLAVGSPLASGPVDANTGATYVFALNGGQWTQTTKLTALDGHFLDAFGFAVALAGGILAIGAPYGGSGAPYIGNGGGTVYIYTQSSGGWMPLAELQDTFSFTADQFGAAIALSGANLAVGAYGRYDAIGKAYLFTLSSGAWSRANAFTAADGQPFDSFGAAVALSGSSLAIGAPYANNGTGSLYAF